MEIRDYFSESNLQKKIELESQALRVKFNKIIPTIKSQSPFEDNLSGLLFRNQHQDHLNWL